MNDKQWRGLLCYMATWFNMASVGLLMVGAFQAEHTAGGLGGAIVCGVAGLIAKIWSLK